MQAWEEFLEQMEEKLGREIVSQWLHTLKIINFDAGNLFLRANDSFQLHWFEEHIRPLLKSKLVNARGKPIRVHLSTADEKKNLPSLKTKQKTKPSFSLIINEDSVDPNLTFSTFFPTESNLLTVQILQESLERPLEEKPTESPLQSAYNPIFIYGPSGSGKTHLLMSCAHQLKKQSLKVFFVRAQTFTDHVVHAIRLGAMQEFRSAYRTLHVLIIDDVHLLAKKNATQEEFFHTFNTLHGLESLLIFSSNVPPRKLSFIEPRLVSRFEWGISLPLEVLSGKELEKAVEQKAKALDLVLGEAELHFILSVFHQRITLIFRALEALSLRLNNKEYGESPLTTSILSHVLADLIEESQQSSLTPEKIVRASAHYFGIRSEDLLGKSQTKECVLPRQIAIYLCRSKLKMPFTSIGKIFQRDHSTIMSSVKHIQKALDEKNAEISSACSKISLHW